MWQSCIYLQTSSSGIWATVLTFRDVHALLLKQITEAWHIWDWCIFMSCHHQSSYQALVSSLCSTLLIQVSACCCTNLRKMMENGHMDCPEPEPEHQCKRRELFEAWLVKVFIWQVHTSVYSHLKADFLALWCFCENICHINKSQVRIYYTITSIPLLLRQYAAEWGSSLWSVLSRFGFANTITFTYVLHKPI